MSTESEGRVPIGSRTRYLVRDLQLLVVLFAVCCMLVVAVTAFGFSGGFFTSSSPSPGNVVTAGTLRMQLTQTGQILDGTGLTPGTTREGDVTVTLLNGHGELDLSATDLAGDTGLADVVDVVVTQTDPGPRDPLFDDPLNELQDADLGSFWALDQGPSDIPAARTYEILIVWPAALDDPANQNSTVNFNFHWQMTSP